MLNYWIYNISDKSLREFLNTDRKYLGINIYTDIKASDVILFFVKNRTNSGCIGWAEVENDICKNETNQKVFNDLNMNKYIFKINNQQILVNAIKIKNVFHFVKSDVVGFKSGTSFNNKYLKNLNMLIKIDYSSKGLILFNKLKEHFNQNPTEYGNAFNIKKISLITTTSSESSPKLSDDIPSDDSEKESESESDENDNNSDNYNFRSSDDEYTTDTDEIKDEPNGIVPILVIPCDDFLTSKNINLSSFKEHIQKCNTCTFNNNNDNVSVTELFKKKIKIEFMIVNDKNDFNLETTLVSYYNCKKYEPSSDADCNLMRIIYINNNDEIYNKCLFITYKNKKN